MAINRDIESDPTLRLSVLELAEALGNVSEACRRSGMDRTSFYEWKRRFESQGMVGLLNQPKPKGVHPQTTKPEVVSRILEISLARPDWGCVRLSTELAEEGIIISAPTVQNILAKNGLASKNERLFQLEERATNEGLELSEDQMEMIYKANPAFRERFNESPRPGSLVCQDTLHLGSGSGFGKGYIQLAVDCYSSFGFARAHVARKPENAVDLLYNDVLPFFRQRGLPLDAVLTDKSREFTGSGKHIYGIFLALSDINHVQASSSLGQTNGFMERFKNTVWTEFVRAQRAFGHRHTLTSLQADLDKWLLHYNEDRPLRGYRNMGKPPVEMIAPFIQEP